MRCHYCGFKSPPPNECKDCGSHQLQLEGYGTEKITEVLQSLLPDTKIERFDQESTKKKKAHKEIMNRFKAGETHILVGTQLLAKGFDFKNVDFVGVVNADHLLHFPDFRSGERTFQLLTQVAGRTGRHDNQGKVLLQSYRPEHPIIDAIVQTDYDSMFKSELNDRDGFSYPPFTRLVLIQIKDFDALTAENAARWLGQKLKEKLAHRVIGPSKPPISKINRWYIREILIKIDKKKDHLKGIKNEINKICLGIKTQGEYKKTRVIINVDPN
jgi:primosomal protein N' (replication factor Y)